MSTATPRGGVSSNLSEGFNAGVTGRAHDWWAGGGKLREINMKFLVLFATAFALVTAMIPEANARRCEFGPYRNGCAGPEGVAHHSEHRPHSVNRNYR